MLVYNFITPEGAKFQISIELLNTPFTNRWINYLEKISGRCPNIQGYVGGLNEATFRREAHNNVSDLLKIRDCFNFINRNGLENFAEDITIIEKLMAFPEQVQQHHLNKWHRMFTSCEMKYLKEGRKLPDNIDRQELWQIIQDINTYVHHIELWTYYEMQRRKPFYNQRQFSIQFTNANNLNYLNKENQVFSQKNIEFIEPGGFDFFNEEYHHTVWLHEDITGKDQMKAWLDEDDLTEFDITGNLLMTPSITLDPFMIYPRILDNPKFREESKASGKTLDRYPLGNIILKDEIDWSGVLRDYSVESVMLYGKKLWPKDIL
jgi:hypothetical protein